MSHTQRWHDARARRLAAHLVAVLGTAIALPRAHASAPLQQPAGAVQQQAGAVTGRITDARSGQGLTRVTVQVEGTRLGATSGDDGRFRITGLPPGTYTIASRRLGYALTRQTVTVGAGASATADMALAPMATALDQVVITGTAGGEQRRSIGNAVATIDAADATEKSGAQSLSTLIGARAPGVIIAPSTGRLGAGPSIQVRGRSSIGLDNSPLLYVDGIRVNNATTAGPVGVSGRLGGQASNVSGRLNDIDPDDIESIEIIKGPAAATIYGTEAANGVIQIITKKGIAGAKPQVTARVQNGLITFLNAEERVPTNYAKDASGNVVAWNGVRAERERGTPIYKTGQTRVFDLGVSGGRDIVRYFLSGMYQNDLGIEPNNSLRQFGFRGNTNLTLSPQLEMATNLGYTNLVSHLGSDVGVSALLGSIAGHDLLFKNGRGFYPNFPPEVPQTLYDNMQAVGRFTGSTTLTHRPTDWLNQRLVVGIDHTSDDSRAIERFAPPELAALIGAAAAGGSIGQTLRRTSVVSTDYAISAKRDVTEALSTTTSLGGQFYRTELHSSFLGGIGFPGPGVEMVSAVSQPATATQSQILNTTIGAYGQLQLGWRNRLFVTGAMRVDNNSAFGSDLKWVTYPKLSTSWVVDEEPFWGRGWFVNSLKLRGAYGESGRQPNAFSALRTYSPAQGPGGTSAVTPNSIGNAELRPERGKELELGFEAGIFRKLVLDVTYFDKRVTDVIINQPIAPSSGFAGNRFANLGRVDNSGIEVAATLQAFERERFSWEIAASVATSADEIKDLGGIGGIVLNAGQTNVVGRPIGALFARRVVSADRDPATGMPTNIRCDAGAGLDPVPCASAPFQFIGTPTPKMTGAITNTFWLAKAVRLHALVDFKRGHRIVNNNEQIRCLGTAGAPLCRSSYFPLEYDPVYIAPRTGTAAALGILDQYYQDASFAKLREVSVTYDLPERFRAGLSRASISLAGRDLHTWTKYPGLDPEANTNNVATSSASADQGLMPPLTRFLATLTVTF